MIKVIRVKNLKSIRNLKLGLSNLNLLFGMNGMGKSSVIQSILLCRQSFWKNNRHHLSRLFVNGELIKLGTAGEIFNASAEQGETLDISFYYSEKNNYCFSYSYDINLIHENCLGRSNVPDDENYDCSVFSDDFVYLSAEHIGPKNKYDYSEWINSGINKFGINGEYAVPYLADHGEDIVPEELCCRNVSEKYSNSLIDQVSAWMSKISPGAKLSTELIPADQEAKLKISYYEKWSVSNPYSPVNVGFGIPYVLPVIIALLTCKKGSLIIIENPESHLHPKGQTAISELIAVAAQYGAQIICESHSDHIINGIRVAAKERIIDHSKITVNYFQKNDELNTEAVNINVDSNGNLNQYPDGLLDEWGELMSKLI